MLRDYNEIVVLQKQKKKEKIISVLKGARRKFQNMAGYPPTKWNTYKTRQIDIQMWRKFKANTHSLPHRESFLICFQNVSNISHMSQCMGREGDEEEYWGTCLKSARKYLRVDKNV